MTVQELEEKLENLRREWRVAEVNRKWIIEQQARLLKMALERCKENEPEDINQFAEKLFSGKI